MFGYLYIEVERGAWLPEITRVKRAGETVRSIFFIDFTLK